MYLALRIVSVILKIAALIQFIFGGWFAAMVMVNAPDIITFAAQLGLQIPASLVVIVGMFLGLQVFVGSVFTFAQGQLIDVALSIEKSAYHLRESAAGITPLSVVARRP